MSVALATEPVDEEHLAAASDSGWALADQSQKSGMILTLMIVVLMVPAFVLQDINLIVYFSIPIVLYAVFLAIRVLMPGGTFDKAFDSVDAQMAHLGLRSVERPSIAVVPRVGGEGAQAKVVGQTVLAGTRHGRAVEVVMNGSRIETRVRDRDAGLRAARIPAAGQAEGRLRTAARGAMAARPARSVDLLDRDEAEGRTGRDRRARKSAADNRWVYDLWLAEALADAFSRARVRA